MAANPEPFSGKRLDSWKEIAAFFGRAERTVKRWETERGLPVHRVPGSGRSAVFAYSEELAIWLKGEGEELEKEESSAAGIGGTEGPSPEAAKILELSPTRNPLASLTVARILAWAVPLALVIGLVLFLSTGHPELRFKALAGRHSPNSEAQDLYLKGRYYWERRTPEDLNKAVDYFTQSIVKDPSAAQAYVGLADCYNLLREFGAMPSSAAFPRALAAAQRAVELDDTSAEAHVSLAFSTFWWSWKGNTAEREFQRALQLDPKLVRAHHWYATYLLALHRYPEALDQIEQAQRLDPASNALLADKGFLLWDSGHHDEGIAILTQLEATEPLFSSTHEYLGRIYWKAQEYDKALAEWRRAAELRHDNDAMTLADARKTGLHANGLQGLHEEELPIQKDLVDHGLGSAYDLAATYAALGDRTEALAYLQTSFDRHEDAMLVGNAIPELIKDSEYQNLRNEVRNRLAQ